MTAPEASRPPSFVLTLVSDRRRLAGRDLASLAREAARAGVDQIQVREKDLTDRALLGLVREVLAAAGGTPARILVNGRPEVALLAGAHGVQLPEEGLPARAVRGAFPTLVLGVSCHSLEAALLAEESGADFVLLGPVFPTPGKEERPLGLGALAEVTRRVRIPVHAIGGIDAGNARAVREAGARGVAAIRPFLREPLATVIGALRGP